VALCTRLRELLSGHALLAHTGNDRTGFNIDLTNNSTGNGLSLHTFEGTAFIENVFAANLSRTDWHILTVSAVFDADSANDVSNTH
jgi:hypothetical protein